MKNTAIQKLEDQRKFLNKKWTEVRSKLSAIESKLAWVAAEQMKIELAKKKAKAPKPLFEKGDVLFRDNLSKPGDYQYPWRGRVRITSEADFEWNQGWVYSIEYVRKDGTLCKKQPSGSSWESQLRNLHEGEL